MVFVPRVLGQLFDSECNKELLDQSRATNTQAILDMKCHRTWYLFMSEGEQQFLCSGFPTALPVNTVVQFLEKRKLLLAMLERSKTKKTNTGNNKWLFVGTGETGQREVQ